MKGQMLLHSLNCILPPNPLALFYPLLWQNRLSLPIVCSNPLILGS